VAVTCRPLSQTPSPCWARDLRASVASLRLKAQEDLAAQPLKVDLASRGLCPAPAPLVLALCPPADVRHGLVAADRTKPGGSIEGASGPAATAPQTASSSESES